MRMFVTGLEGMTNVVGVEVGVLRGEHAKELTEGLDNLKLLHLVDPYNPDIGDVPYTQQENNNWKKLAMLNLASHMDKVAWHFVPSVEASKRFEDASLDFVYIDGDHSLEGATNDIRFWTPKVKKGGIVAGHDYNYPSVNEAIKGIIDETINDGHDWYFRI